MVWLTTGQTVCEGTPLKMSEQVGFGGRFWSGLAYEQLSELAVADFYDLSCTASPLGSLPMRSQACLTIHYQLGDVNFEEKVGTFLV